MNDILETVILIIIAVTIFTVIYKLLPFKTWGNKKPKFTLFPKYIAQFNKPISEIEAALEKIQFKKTIKNNYTRSKIYGDFSAKAIKLSVEIDEENKQIKIYSPFIGIFFDTGDIWQVVADIIND